MVYSVSIDGYIRRSRSRILRPSASDPHGKAQSYVIVPSFFSFATALGKISSDISLHGARRSDVSITCSIPAMRLSPHDITSSWFHEDFFAAVETFPRARPTDSGPSTSYAHAFLGKRKMTLLQAVQDIVNKVCFGSKLMVCFPPHSLSGTLSRCFR